MNNFDLKKFLVENKLTSNSRQLNDNDINEALNKSLQDFGPDLQKRLQTVGLQAKVFPKAPEGDMVKRLQDNPKLAYIQFENGVIKIYAGEKSLQSIQKVVDYFNLDSTQYGPEKDAGWVVKNAINKNPGDIMASKVAIQNGLAQVTIYRFEKGSYKNVKTTDKATGKADYLQAAESINEIGANDMVISYRDEEKIPIKFTGLEAFDGRNGNRDTTRNDGSFVVTLHAERVDGEKLGGKEKFKVNIMFSGNKIGQDGTVPFPDYDKYGHYPEVVDYGNTFEYIKDNL